MSLLANEWPQCFFFFQVSSRLVELATTGDASATMVTDTMCKITR